MLEKIRDINKIYHQKKIHKNNIDIDSQYPDTKKPAPGWFFVD
ncbi:conserved hypothetical protein [Vibrio crassostreae]|nr:conserved hypothetical protein [Vibrio crassostreae]CAK1877476.1 conserved hypothetical protein [Vibrio crassostreae]CAK2209562.1 conserved hypothetical protein [Vibrio crassostreae]CAK2286339.1 conserved hypothetical protein [Vibrio crassostreae]CAK2700391.1 conserved hypothetical protein [Vibrio crassostreae]